jgi:hypothetical protein
MLSGPEYKRIDDCIVIPSFPILALTAYALNRRALIIIA